MSNYVMENAQALAATAKFGSEPERAQILLLEVYTSYRVAPESKQGQSGKKHQRRHLVYGNPRLDATLMVRDQRIWRC